MMIFRFQEFIMARVLIVDDSKFMRRIIRTALESGGHEIVAEAENGMEGLARYKELKPDIVTMDITMMGQDGLKTVDALVAFDPGSRIIVISAMNEFVLKNARGMNIPVKGFIQKPFEKEDLLKMVADAL
jgi:two-component system chemotaxis response regulator CheY